MGCNKNGTTEVWDKGIFSLKKIYITFFVGNDIPLLLLNVYMTLSGILNNNLNNFE